MTALLLTAALMMPAEFTGRWTFTSFQARPVRLEVTWVREGWGESRRSGGVEAFRDEGGPLTVYTFSRNQCMFYVVTRATPDHRHLWGVYERRDSTCTTVVRRGTFRAHRRRP